MSKEKGMTKNEISISSFNKTSETGFGSVGFPNWHGGVGVIQLPRDRVARIEMDTHGISGKFQRLNVDIVSKDTGNIDSHCFLFSEFLKHHERFGEPYITQCGTYKWAGYVPEDLSNLMIAVRDYILEWV